MAIYELIGKAIDPALNITSAFKLENWVGQMEMPRTGARISRTKGQKSAGVPLVVCGASTGIGAKGLGATHRACTLELFTNRHQSQHRPLTTMVPSIIVIAGVVLLQR